MSELRMVRLVTASNPMQARIIAARLGAEGIVWQFQGSVDGPLAVGPVDVLVDEAGFESASELLLTDDVESSFGGDSDQLDTSWSRSDVLWLALVIAVLVLFAVARMAARV